MTIDSSLRTAFAPEGRLRASINLGNPILAGRDATTGEPVGVSVDLARALAERLSLDLDLVVWESAGKSVDAVAEGLADLGFFAIDPKRGEQIAFSPPYVLIEGSYLVTEDAMLRTQEDVDREGITVVVGRGSAYDLFLTRELRHARIERAPTSPEVVDFFLDQGHTVAAGVRQQLEADAARIGGLRLLPGRFMVIRQAMGMRPERGADAVRFLGDFIEEAKRSGFVARALERHAIQGASIAPAAADR